MFLSLLSRNLPSILTANTLRPLSELISMMVLHVSYNIALPTFLLLSVLVATCKNQRAYQIRYLYTIWLNSWFAVWKTNLKATQLDQMKYC